MTPECEGTTHTVLDPTLAAAAAPHVGGSPSRGSSYHAPCTLLPALPLPRPPLQGLQRAHAARPRRRFLRQQHHRRVRRRQVRPCLGRPRVARRRAPGLSGRRHPGRLPGHRRQRPDPGAAPWAMDSGNGQAPCCSWRGGRRHSAFRWPHAPTPPGRPAFPPCAALQTSLSADNTTFTVGAGSSNVMTITALHRAAGPGVGVTTGVGSFVGTAGFNLVRGQSVVRPWLLEGSGGSARWQAVCRKRRGVGGTLPAVVNCLASPAPPPPAPAGRRLRPAWALPGAGLRLRGGPGDGAGRRQRGER